jgi:hypothetical protein
MSKNCKCWVNIPLLVIIHPADLMCIKILLDCPYGFRYINNKCYKFVNEMATFAEQITACANHSSILMSITSDISWAVVNEMVGADITKMFIGVRRDMSTKAWSDLQSFIYNTDFNDNRPTIDNDDLIILNMKTGGERHLIFSSDENAFAAAICYYGINYYAKVTTIRATCKQLLID